jgi:hypothetical protein
VCVMVQVRYCCCKGVKVLIWLLLLLVGAHDAFVGACWMV